MTTQIAAIRVSYLICRAQCGVKIKVPAKGETDWGKSVSPSHTPPPPHIGHRNPQLQPPVPLDSAP